MDRLQVEQVSFPFLFRLFVVFIINSVCVTVCVSVWVCERAGTLRPDVCASQMAAVMSHCSRSPGVLVITSPSPGVMGTLLPAESSCRPQLSFLGPSLKGTKAQG